MAKNSVAKYVFLASDVVFNQLQLFGLCAKSFCYRYVFLASEVFFNLQNIASVQSRSVQGHFAIYVSLYNF